MATIPGRAVWPLVGGRGATLGDPRVRRPVARSRLPEGRRAAMIGDPAQPPAEVSHHWIRGIVFPVTACPTPRPMTASLAAMMTGSWPPARFLATRIWHSRVDNSPLPGSTWKMPPSDRGRTHDQSSAGSAAGSGCPANVAGRRPFRGESSPKRWRQGVSWQTSAGACETAMRPAMPGRRHGSEDAQRGICNSGLVLLGDCPARLNMVVDWAPEALSLWRIAASSSAMM